MKVFGCFQTACRDSVGFAGDFRGCPVQEFPVGRAMWLRQWFPDGGRGGNCGVNWSGGQTPAWVDPALKQSISSLQDQLCTKTLYCFTT